MLFACLGHICANVLNHCLDLFIFTMQRYASAVYAVIVGVRPWVSVRGRFKWRFSSNISETVQDRDIVTMER